MEEQKINDDVTFDNYKAARGRNWCYTLNNYSEGELTYLTKLDCVYHIFGKEVGESGTPHLQGTVCFVNAKSFKAVKGIIGQHAHLEPVISLPDSIEYCKKEGNFFEFGTKPPSAKERGSKGKEHGIKGKGPHNKDGAKFGEIGGKMEQDRWATALEHCKNQELELIEPQLQICHAKSLDFLATKFLRDQILTDVEHNNYWVYGQSGIGKSRWARRVFGDKLFLKICNKWWDGYKMEPFVLLEDFDADHSKLLHFMKIWADRYPFPAEVKGGMLKIRPCNFIVTSNYHPREIWPLDKECEPILRRFKVGTISDGEFVQDETKFDTFVRIATQTPLVMLPVLQRTDTLPLPDTPPASQVSVPNAPRLKRQRAMGADPNEVIDLVSESDESDVEDAEEPEEINLPQVVRRLFGNNGEIRANMDLPPNNN